MKRIYKLLPVFLCIILVFSPITIAAAEKKVLSFDDFVVDVTNDNVTVCIPSDNAAVYVHCFDHDIKELFYGNEVYISDITANKCDVAVEIYPHGIDSVFDSDFLPSGTSFVLEFTIYQSHSMDDILIPVDHLMYSQYYNFDSQFNEISCTKTNVYDVSNADSLSIEGTYQKSADTQYCEFGFYSHFSVWGSDARIHLEDFYLTFSISSALREQQQTGKTNKLLQTIISGSSDQLDQADDLRSDVDDRVSDLEEIRSGISDVYKPEIYEVADLVNTFDVVSPSEISSYTDIFKSLLDSDIVVSMMMICVSISLISLVLFGKKG